MVCGEGHPCLGSEVGGPALAWPSPPANPAGYGMTLDPWPQAGVGLWDAVSHPQEPSTAAPGVSVHGATPGCVYPRGLPAGGACERVRLQRLGMAKLGVGLGVRRTGHLGGAGHSTERMPAGASAHAPEAGARPRAPGPRGPRAWRRAWGGGAGRLGRGPLRP